MLRWHPRPIPNHPVGGETAAKRLRKATDARGIKKKWSSGKNVATSFNHPQRTLNPINTSELK